MSSFRHALVFATLIAAPAVRGGQSPVSPAAVEQAHQHFVAGDAAYKAGRWQDALNEFSAGFALDPRPEFLLNLAQTRRHLGRLDEAIANCESFLAVAPDSPLAPQVWKLLGELQERQRVVERARAAALEGKQHADAGDWAGALAAYEKANFQDLDEPRYLRNIADCLKALHRDAEALRFYRLYLKERPKDPERPQIEAAMRELSPPGSPPAEAAPSPSLTPSPALALTSAPLEARRKPVWRRWWFWTVLGGAAVAVAVGVGVGVAERPHSTTTSPFMPTLPSFGPGLVQR